MLGHLSDPDLHLVRVFLAVANAGGVSAAQASLNVSQSTISVQLASLETRVGYRLCERGRSGFRLTPKGLKFLDASQRLISAVDAFCGEARHIDKTLVGTLAIGMIGHTATSASARLSEAVARFRRRDEAVRLSMVVRTPAELENQVIHGDLDVAIGYFWHRVPSLEYLPLFAERQAAYCGRLHPLYSRAGTLSLAESAEHDWVWRSYPVPEVKQQPPAQRITAVADNMEAVTVFILSGRHLGYLPEHHAAPLVDQGLLAPLNPAELFYEVTFHMLTRRAIQRREVLEAFVEDMVLVHGCRNRDRTV